MTKQMLAVLLSLALLPLLLTDAEGQTSVVSETEIIGDFDGYSYRLMTSAKDNILIRTDEGGSLIWSYPIKPLDDDSLYFMSSQNEFIVAGITDYNKKKGKIISDPSNYEYWLVPIKSILDGMACIPNPSMHNTTLLINEDSKIECIRLIDATNKEIMKLFRMAGENRIELNVSYLRSGIYFLDATDSSGNRIDTIKIIKL